MWSKWLQNRNSLIVFWLTLSIGRGREAIVVQSQFNDNDIAPPALLERRTTIEMANYLLPQRAMPSNSFYYPLVINTTPLSYRPAPAKLKNESETKPVMGESAATVVASHYDNLGGEHSNDSNRPNYANHRPTKPTSESHQNMFANGKAEPTRLKPSTLMTDVSIHTLSSLYKHFTSFVGDLLSANSNTTTANNNYFPNLALIVLHVLSEQAPKYLNDFAEQIRHFYRNCHSEKSEFSKQGTSKANRIFDGTLENVILLHSFRNDKANLWPYLFDRVSGEYF